MEDKKIFDDFPEVDCNHCDSYWSSQCDGTPVGSEKRCTAFKATRKVNIPLEIEALRERLKRLSVSCILVDCALIFHIISHILGWV